jgi:hypothetical protein
MKLFAALSEDVQQGWVWLVDPRLPPRGIVKLLYRGKAVYCEALQIDRNFLKRYNVHGEGRCFITDPQKSLVINGWYRAKLGNPATKEDHSVTIRACSWWPFSWYGKVWACLEHPQIVVRVATWTGIIGVVLGILGIVLGILPFLHLEVPH